MAKVRAAKSTEFPKNATRSSPPILQGIIAHRQPSWSSITRIRTAAKKLMVPAPSPSGSVRFKIMKTTWTWFTSDQLRRRIGIYGFKLVKMNIQKQGTDKRRCSILTIRVTLKILIYSGDRGKATNWKVWGAPWARLSWRKLMKADTIRIELSSWLIRFASEYSTRAFILFLLVFLSQ